MTIEKKRESKLYPYDQMVVIKHDCANLILYTLWKKKRNSYYELVSVIMNLSRLGVY